MKYWKRVDTQGKTTTVESYSHDLDVEGALEIDKAEFDDFINSMPIKPMIPGRDILKEFDGLKATLKVKGIIE